jgi:hypothetical protein
VHGSVEYVPPELASWSVQFVVVETPVATENVYVTDPVKLDGDVAELSVTVKLVDCVRLQDPKLASVPSTFEVDAVVRVAVVELRVPETSSVPSVLAM